MRRVAFAALAAWLPLAAADPEITMFWPAEEVRRSDEQIAGRVDPERHVGVARLLDSVTVIHRDGPSEVEIHVAQADFVFVRAGEGAVLVGGTSPDARLSDTGELRGRRIEGATRYALKAGDQIYIPANTPHQFLVEPGKTMTATIVKITPKR